MREPLSLRRRNKLLAGGLEIMEELSEVHREFAQAASAALLEALRRCKDGPDCPACLSAAEMIRRHCLSVQVARKVVDEYVATQARKVGLRPLVRSEPGEQSDPDCGTMPEVSKTKH